jgi:hypothetical protein
MKAKDDESNAQSPSASITCWDALDEKISRFTNAQRECVRDDIANRELPRLRRELAQYTESYGTQIAECEHILEQLDKPHRKRKSRQILAPEDMWQLDPAY